MSLQTALDGFIDNLFAKLEASVGDTNTAMSEWNANWPDSLGDTPAERTVKNWIVVSREVELNLPDDVTFLNTIALQNIIDVVVSTLSAAVAAESAGRIDATQATAIETAYNNAWT